MRSSLVRLCSLILGIAILSGYAHAKTQLPPKWDFQGKSLVVLSDADMLASAYENGQLGPRDGADRLSLIPLDSAPHEYRAFAAEASNSVAGPPVSMAVSPDGRFAFVVESFTPRPGRSDEETFADLRMGNTLTVIDVQNPRKPRVRERFEIKQRPDAVSVSHDGRYLAVTFHPRGAGKETPLGIYRIDGGKLQSQHYPTIPDFELSKRLISASWHPERHVLGLINETDAIVQFVSVQEDNAGMSLQNWGNSVSIGKGPFIGQFTRDGGHFLVNNLYWGPDVKNTWTEAPRGTLVNITLEHGELQNGQPRHSLTSQVMVGASPEGFAVSPDGRYVAAVNMERSWLTYDDPQQTWFSSISLIERDPDTGAMHYLHTTPYYSILPEAAVFDASGRYLAVVNYDHYDHTRPGGSVDFFKLVRDPLEPRRKMLVQTNYAVEVQRGAHVITLIE